MIYTKYINLLGIEHREGYGMLVESNPKGKRHSYTLYLWDMYTKDMDCIKTIKPCTQEEYLETLKDTYAFLDKCYVSDIKYRGNSVSILDEFQFKNPIKSTSKATYYAVFTNKYFMRLNDEMTQVLSKGNFSNSTYFILAFDRSNNYHLVLDYNKLMPAESSLYTLCKKYNIKHEELKYLGDYEDYGYYNVWVNPKVLNNFYLNFPQMVQRAKNLGIKMHLSCIG